MKNKTTLIILGIIVAIGLFYGGYAYGSSSNVSSAVSARTGRTGTTSFAGYPGANALGSATTGIVVSSDATSITVALKSGSAVVFYSTSTPIMKTVSGSENDISTGANITVIGTTNSDGSIIANSIQIR